jgi:hypothetical protein
MYFKAIILTLSLCSFTFAAQIRTIGWTKAINYQIVINYTADKGNCIQLAYGSKWGGKGAVNPNLFIVPKNGDGTQSFYIPTSAKYICILVWKNAQECNSKGGDLSCSKEKLIPFGFITSSEWIELTPETAGAWGFNK